MLVFLSGFSWRLRRFQRRFGRKVAVTPRLRQRRRSRSRSPPWLRSRAGRPANQSAIQPSSQYARLSSTVDGIWLGVHFALIVRTAAVGPAAWRFIHLYRRRVFTDIPINRTKTLASFRRWFFCVLNYFLHGQWNTIKTLGLRFQ